MHLDAHPHEPYIATRHPYGVTAVPKRASICGPCGVTVVKGPLRVLWHFWPDRRRGELPPWKAISAGHIATNPDSKRWWRGFPPHSYINQSDTETARSILQSIPQPWRIRFAPMLACGLSGTVSWVPGTSEGSSPREHHPPRGASPRPRNVALAPVQQGGAFNWMEATAKGPGHQFTHGMQVLRLMVLLHLEDGLMLSFEVAPFQVA
jgi:hypothetical protein